MMLILLFTKKSLLLKWYVCNLIILMNIFFIVLLINTFVHVYFKVTKTRLQEVFVFFFNTTGNKVV